jgi:NADPH:quinone reductase-like Zn-dependent oxidoreductase
MKAVVVVEAGRPPVYREFPDPVPGAEEVLIRVHTAALSTLVRSRASGTHYSSKGQLPFVVGVDGVGELEDGTRVYFGFPSAPYGSFSELTVAPRTHTIRLPDGLDDVTAAALGNPGFAAWGALRERGGLRSGENVLVNGATGTAGRLTVQLAKHLGARRVVATGRNPEELNAVSQLGADATILLAGVDDAFEEAVQAQFREFGIDVVVDFLWGPSAERIIAAGAKAGRDAVPIRFVHVGSLSAPTITLPSAALRSSALELMGSGIGSIPPDRVLSSIGEVLKAAVPAGFKVETRVLPLTEVERAWPSPEGIPRTVVRVR